MGSVPSGNTLRTTVCPSTTTEHPGRIHTRDPLMDAMYRDERVVADRTVDSHVKKIRRKIAAVLPDREILHSVYGVGSKYEW
jgi:two-component system response regulator BaeR